MLLKGGSVQFIKLSGEDSVPSLVLEFWFESSDPGEPESLTLDCRVRDTKAAIVNGLCNSVFGNVDSLTWIITVVPRSGPGEVEDTFSQSLLAIG